MNKPKTMWIVAYSLCSILILIVALLFVAFYPFNMLWFLLWVPSFLYADLIEKRFIENLEEG